LLLSLKLLAQNFYGTFLVTQVMPIRAKEITGHALLAYKPGLRNGKGDATCIAGELL